MPELHFFRHVKHCSKCNEYTSIVITAQIIDDDKTRDMGQRDEISCGHCGTNLLELTDCLPDYQYAQTLKFKFNDKNTALAKYDDLYRLYSHRDYVLLCCDSKYDVDFLEKYCDRDSKIQNSL